MEHKLTEEEWQRLGDVIIDMADLIQEITAHIVEFEERLSNLEAR